MMVVLAVFAILALLAIPSNTSAIQRNQINKAITIVDHYTQQAEAFYRLNDNTFPNNNTEAGIPASDKLISPFSTELQLSEGAFHLTLGNDVAKNLQGKVISIRPLVVTDSPESPIFWSCGNKPPPEGMEAVGENRTDVEPISLPLKCR